MTGFKVGDRVINTRTNEPGTVVKRDPGCIRDIVTVVYDGDDQEWNTPTSKLILEEDVI